jgi:hypothetical protein
MASHVDIDGSTYCLMDNGLAARITMQTQTELVVLTDSVVRATWLLGGQWDGGSNPWYTPTPNPIELELLTADPRWNPTSLTFYAPAPLRTILSVWLAEQDTFGTWVSDRRAHGVVLDWRYVPAPAGAATVILSGIDAMTSMADATLEERAEENPYNRLLYVAGRTKGIYPNLRDTDLAGPTIGRYHPSAGTTALDHAVSVALAAGQALAFFPYTHATDPTIHTMMMNLPLDTLGAPQATFLASTDPGAGAVSPGPNPANPVFGAQTLVACIEAVELAKSDAAFRTRIDSARAVAFWVLGASDPSGVKAPGVYGWQAQNALMDAGDVWTMTYTAGVNWTGPPPSVRAFLHNGATYVFGDERPWTVTGYAFTYVHRVTAPGFVGGGGAAMGYNLTVPSGGTATIPAGQGWQAKVERAAGTGPVSALVATTADEATNGIRALTGFTSPIARQADLDYWNARALQWVPHPRKLNAALLRVASSVAHPSPGARQWALHLLPGSRMALALDTTTYPPPFTPSLTPWVVACRFTLEPDSITLDLTCAPPTMNN